jgi:hypothetical protein
MIERVEQMLERTERTNAGKGTLESSFGSQCGAHRRAAAGTQGALEFMRQIQAANSNF